MIFNLCNEMRAEYPSNGTKTMINKKSAYQIKIRPAPLSCYTITKNHVIRVQQYKPDNTVKQL